MVQEKLQEIFREILANEELELTFDMGTDDIEEWDSLTHIILVEEAEKTFNIKIDMDEVFKIRTFGDFVSTIEKYI